MARSFRHIRVTALLLLVLIATPLAKATDPPLTIAIANACALMNTNLFCASSSPPVLTGAPASVNGTYALLPGVNMTVNGSGQATYGVLRADASASFGIAGTPVAAYSYGAAAFRDVVLYESPPFDGTPGLLFVTYTLSGTIAGTANSTAGISVETYGGPTDSQTMYQNYASSVSGVFSAPAAIPFIWGQPFNLGLELWAEAGTHGSVTGIYPPAWAAPLVGTGFASANFANTLVLVGLTPADANGNPVIGATISSTSGTQYSQDGVLQSFSKFSACTEVEVEDRAFNSGGSFSLGPGTDGIAPLTEDVTLQIGAFSATIAAGSFSLDEKGNFVFQGIVNGASLGVSILPQKEEFGSFQYRLSGRHANLSGTSKPVTVRLIIGGDGGQTKSSCTDK